MKRQFLSALRVTLFLILVCGIIYPLSVTAVGNLVFPRQAQGSLIHDQGKVIGSSLLGQAFEGGEWFHPRSSHAGEGYDATASAASNLGPTNPDFLALVKDRGDQYRQANNLSDDADIPVDAVTSSASGLDPHISLANAKLQTRRVALARDVSTDTIVRLVKNNTQSPYFNLLGQKTVNVVTLNRDLANLTRKPQ